MSDQQPDATGRPQGRQGNSRLIAILAVAAIAVAVAALVVVLNDDDTDVATTPGAGTTTTSTSTKPSSTTGTAPTTTVPSDGTYDTAVWPWAGSTRRFTDPVDAARSFAVDYVGFTNPVVGAFQQGDSRSGEIEVRPETDGPVTTVFLRQLGPDNTWWALGSATANIEVDQPAALSAIDSPVTLKGRASAFEGNVNVTIRVDGTDQPLAEGFVTGSGSSDGTLGPFESAQQFPKAGGRWGAIVFRTLSAEDGSVLEAGVIRVGFVGGGY